MVQQISKVVGVQIIRYCYHVGCAEATYMRYLGNVLRLPPDRIVRRSLIVLVKGGTYYPEGSLFSDCEVDYLHELLETATNRSAWRTKRASLT